LDKVLVVEEAQLSDDARLAGLAVVRHQNEESKLAALFGSEQLPYCVRRIEPRAEVLLGEFSECLGCLFDRNWVPSFWGRSFDGQNNLTYHRIHFVVYKYKKIFNTPNKSQKNGE
jgi:hypothetical protein